MKLITENIKPFLSEGIKYHINHNIPISENIYRWGSVQFFKLFNEARKLYKTGVLTELNQMDKWFLETDLGKIGIYEGRKVLLDFPITITEAEYQGKDVQLNKPKRGGSKKFYVYVKDGERVKKVAFGAAGGGGSLAVKLKDPKARKAFADRHNCDQKKDRTTPGYWSCNLPRYAKALGMGGGGNYYW